MTKLDWTDQPLFRVHAFIDRGAGNPAGTRRVCADCYWVTSKRAMSASSPTWTCSASVPRMFLRVMRNGPGCTVSASWAATARAGRYILEGDDLVEETGVDRLVR